MRILYIIDGQVLMKRSSGFTCSAVSGGGVLIAGPDCYKYKIIPPISGRTERFVSVGLRVSDLPKSVAYWCGLNGMTSYPSAATSGGDGCPNETVGYAEEQVRQLGKSSLTQVIICVLESSKRFNVCSSAQGCNKRVAVEIALERPKIF